MAERLSKYTPEERKEDRRTDTGFSLTYEEIRDLYLEWIEALLELPKNKEIIRKIKEAEYNTNNGE